MSNKTFVFAGVSRLNGVIKARFANDQMRVKVLLNGGHTDIDIVPLMGPMTKVQAVEKLIQAEFHKGNVEILAALEAELDKRTPKSTKKPAISLEAIKAKAKPKAKVVVKEDENESF
jgi:hypothetical protein